MVAMVLLSRLLGGTRLNSFPAISLHAPDRNWEEELLLTKEARSARATLGHTRKYIDTSEVVRLIFRETMFVVFILRNNETRLIVFC